jgi:hypothetical protein
VPLDPLTLTEACDMLVRRLGPSRVMAEPDAVNTILARCAGLPVALALVAARAATNPHLSLADLADNDARLDVLSDPDPAADLRAVFTWSYATITPAAQRRFRLFGLHPGPTSPCPSRPASPR